jgi:hypothetical protein
MSAEDRELTLHTLVAQFQGMLLQSEAKVRSQESEMKALRDLCDQLTNEAQGLKITARDAREAYEQLKGIHERNVASYSSTMEGWWRDRDKLVAERDAEREKLRQLGEVEWNNEMLRREIRDLKEKLLWAERRESEMRRQAESR